MTRIRHSVGKSGPNDSDDVLLIQQALARHAKWLGGLPPPNPTGRWDLATAKTLDAFERNGAALKTPSGTVDPHGWTMTALEKQSISGPTHRIFLAMCWLHGPALTDADYTAASSSLGCDPAAILAVARVETKRSPWFEVERPSILFERHIFRDLTGGVYNKSHPDLSGPQSAAAYGSFASQYTKLRRAAMLDEDAALKSASWGMFQILGRYHVQAGFGSVRAFVDAMMRGEQQHLAAFVSFINADRRLKKALVDHDWPTFARVYNGPTYYKTHYDQNMAAAYAAIKPDKPTASAAGGRP